MERKIIEKSCMLKIMYKAEFRGENPYRRMQYEEVPVM